MDDAADAEAVLVVRVARLAAEQAAAPLHGNRPGRRRARRKTAIRRIDHERGAPRRRVVFAPVRNRGGRALHAAGQDVDGREVLLIADADVLHALRVLLVGQELPRAVLRGPLERHAVLAFGRPLAMQIGVAPRRARRATPCRFWSARRPREWSTSGAPTPPSRTRRRRSFESSSLSSANSMTRACRWRWRVEVLPGICRGSTARPDPGRLNWRRPRASASDRRPA